MSTDLVTIARHLPAPMDGGDLGFVNPDTGEALPARDASDRTLLHTLAQIRELEARTREMKLAAAFELQQRHGTGKTHAAGYGFKVNESVSWPKGTTREALDKLVADGIITEADARRAFPEKPVPDGTQINALIRRLTTRAPLAAARLAAAATKSPASVSDIEQESTDGTVAA